MKKILNFKHIKNIEDFHDYMEIKLALPKHYGRNLDGLWDILEEENSLRLEILNAYDILRLGTYGKKILDLFIDLGPEKIKLKRGLIRDYKGIFPKIEDSIFIADNAALSGDVTLGSGSSIWFSATVRSENSPIKIGQYTNIQDNAVIHEEIGHPTVIGDYVTIGHRAIIHGSTIGDNTLIGMGAVILDGAKIGKNCIIGANTLITQNKEIPDNSLVFGSPFKIVRQISEEEAKENIRQAILYKEKSDIYKL